MVRQQHILFNIILHLLLLLLFAGRPTYASSYICRGTANVLPIWITDAESVDISTCLYTKDLLIMPGVLSAPTLIASHGGILWMNFTGVRGSNVRIVFTSQFVNAAGFFHPGNGSAAPPPAIQRINIQFINCLIPNGVTFEFSPIVASSHSNNTAYPPVTILFRDNTLVGSLIVRGIETSSLNATVNLNQFYFTLSRTYVQGCSRCAAVSISDLSLRGGSRILFTDRSNFTTPQELSNLIEVLGVQMHEESSITLTGLCHFTYVQAGRYLGPLVRFNGVQMTTGSTIVLHDGLTMEADNIVLLFGTGCSVDEEFGRSNKRRSGVYFFGNQSIAIYSLHSNEIILSDAPVVRHFEPCVHNLTLDAESKRNTFRSVSPTGAPSIFYSKGSYTLTANATVPRIREGSDAYPMPRQPQWFESIEHLLPAPTTPILHVGRFTLFLLWQESSVIRFLDTLSQQQQRELTTPPPQPISIQYRGLHVAFGGLTIRVRKVEVASICPPVNFSLVDATVQDELKLPDATGDGSTIDVINVRIGNSITLSTWDYTSYTVQSQRFENISISKNAKIRFRNVTRLTETSSAALLFRITRSMAQTRILDMDFVIEDCALGSFMLSSITVGSSMPTAKAQFERLSLKIYRSDFTSRIRSTSFTIGQTTFLESQVAIIDCNASTLTDVLAYQILKVDEVTMRDRSVFLWQGNNAQCLPGGRFHGPCLYFVAFALVNQSSACLINNTVRGVFVAVHFSEQCVAADPVTTTITKSRPPPSSGLYMENNLFAVYPPTTVEVSKVVEMLATAGAFSPSILTNTAVMNSIMVGRRSDATLRIHGFVRNWGRSMRIENIPAAGAATVLGSAASRVVWNIDRFTVTSEASSLSSILDNNPMLQPLVLPASPLTAHWELILNSELLLGLRSQENSDPVPVFSFVLEEYHPRATTPPFAFGLEIYTTGGASSFHALLFNVSRNSTLQSIRQIISADNEDEATKPKMWFVFRNVSANYLWMRGLPSYAQVVIEDCAFGTKEMRPPEVWANQYALLPGIDVSLLPFTTGTQISLVNSSTSASSMQFTLGEGCVNTTLRLIQVAAIRVLLAATPPSMPTNAAGLFEELNCLIEATTIDSRQIPATPAFQMVAAATAGNDRGVILRKSHIMVRACTLSSTILQSPFELSQRMLVVDGGSSVRALSTTFSCFQLGEPLPCIVFPELDIAAAGGALLCFDSVLVRCSYRGFFFGLDVRGLPRYARFNATLAPPLLLSEQRSSSVRIVRSEIVPFDSRRPHIAVIAPSTLPIVWTLPTNLTTLAGSFNATMDVALGEGPSDCGPLPGSIQRLLHSSNDEWYATKWWRNEYVALRLRSAASASYRPQLLACQASDLTEADDEVDQYKLHSATQSLMNVKARTLTRLRDNQPQGDITTVAPLETTVAEKPKRTRTRSWASPVASMNATTNSPPPSRPPKKEEKTSTLTLFAALNDTTTTMNNSNASQNALLLSVEGGEEEEESRKTQQSMVIAAASVSAGSPTAFSELQSLSLILASQCFRTTLASGSPRPEVEERRRHRAERTSRLIVPLRLGNDEATGGLLGLALLFALTVLLHGFVTLGYRCIKNTEEAPAHRMRSACINARFPSLSVALLFSLSVQGFTLEAFRNLLGDEEAGTSKSDGPRSENKNSSALAQGLAVASLLFVCILALLPPVALLRGWVHAVYHSYHATYKQRNFGSLVSKAILPDGFWDGGNHPSPNVNEEHKTDEKVPQPPGGTSAGGSPLPEANLMKREEVNSFPMMASFFTKSRDRIGTYVVAVTWLRKLLLSLFAVAPVTDCGQRLAAFAALYIASALLNVLFRPYRVSLANTLLATGDIICACGVMIRWLGGPSRNATSIYVLGCAGSWMGVSGVVLLVLKVVEVWRVKKWHREAVQAQSTTDLANATTRINDATRAEEEVLSVPLLQQQPAASTSVGHHIASQNPLLTAPSSGEK